MAIYLSPASRSEEGELLNSPSSVRPCNPQLCLSRQNTIILSRRGTLGLRVHWSLLEIGFKILKKAHITNLNHFHPWIFHENEHGHIEILWVNVLFHYKVIAWNHIISGNLPNGRASFKVSHFCQFYITYLEKCWSGQIS